MKKIGIWLVILGALIVGIIGLLAGIEDFQNAKNSPQWPTTQGTIISSKIEEFPYARYSWRRNRLRFNYEYLVDGITYSSDEIIFGQSDNVGGDPEKMREIINRYPSGQNVTVYYQPNDPEIAVLEPGLTKGGFSYIAPGLGAIVVGVLAFFGAKLINEPEKDKESYESGNIITDELVAYISKSKMLVFSLILGAIVIGSSSVVSPIFKSGGWIEGTFVIIGIVVGAVLLIILGIGYIPIVFSKRQPFLIINSDGIKYGKSDLIPWNEIDEIWTREKSIIIFVNNPHKYLYHAPWSPWKLTEKPRQVQISFFLLDCNLGKAWRHIGKLKSDYNLPMTIR